MIIDIFYSLVLGVVSLLTPIISLIPNVAFQDSLVEFTTILNVLFSKVGYFIPVDTIFSILTFYFAIYSFRFSYSLFLKIRNLK